MAGVPNAIDRLRRPEYTGENRCLPCTGLNLAIAAALGVTLGVLSVPVAGVAAFALAAVVIYLRGYLVPGTPTLTKRYLPVRVLELFGKRPDERRAGAIETSVEPSGRAASGDPGGGRSDRTGASGSTPESPGAPDATADSEDGAEATVDDEDPVFVEDTTGFLFEAGIVEECADADDVRLADWFREAWAERLTEFAGSEAAQLDGLATMLGVDPDDLELLEAGDAIIVQRRDEPVGNWISRSAFAADVAADAVLRDVVEGWSRIHVAQRSDMLSPLRGFLETCPLCGGAIALDRLTYDETDAESCCFDAEVYTAQCAECGERFVEIEQMQAGDGRDDPIEERL